VVGSITEHATMQGRIQGGGLGGLPPPSLGSFKLEIMKGSRTITEVILSLNILISFCQVSQPPFKNPGSATAMEVYLHQAVDVQEGFVY